MVQNTRDMDYLIRVEDFDTPECQIIILRALEADPEAANAIDQITAINTQVADHVLRAKEFQVPVRLEVRVQSLTVFIDLVLIRVDEADAGIRHDRLRHQRECVFRQHVIMVKQGNPVAGSQLKRTVRCRRYVSIRLPEHDLDSLVFACQAFERFPYSRVRRSIVGNAQLPMRIKLIPH